MEATRRYRLLIYFVATILCLSACFAYAEEPSRESGASVQHGAKILFQTSQGRSSFMPSLAQAFVPEVSGSEDVAPIISQMKMTEVSSSLQRTHGFWHAMPIGKRKPKLILNRQQDTSSHPSVGMMDGTTFGDVAGDMQ